MKTCAAGVAEDVPDVIRTRTRGLGLTAAGLIFAAGAAQALRLYRYGGAPDWYLPKGTLFSVR